MPRQTKSKTTVRRGPGQPEKEINLKQLETLCQLQCTDEEIGAFFGVSRKTIERRKEREDFRETMQQGKLKGLVSLRRAQFQSALNGNATLQIWLGKQMLGQRDKYEPLPDVTQSKPQVLIGIPDEQPEEAKPLNADSLISAGKLLPVQ